MTTIDQALEEHGIAGRFVEVNGDFIIVDQTLEGDSCTTLAAYLFTTFKKIAKVVAQEYNRALESIRSTAEAAAKPFLSSLPKGRGEIKKHRGGSRNGSWQSAEPHGVCKDGVVIGMALVRVIEVSSNLGVSSCEHEAAAREAIKNASKVYLLRVIYTVGGNLQKVVVDTKVSVNGGDPMTALGNLLRSASEESSRIVREMAAKSQKPSNDNGAWLR